MLSATMKSIFSDQPLHLPGLVRLLKVSLRVPLNKISPPPKKKKTHTKKTPFFDVGGGGGGGGGVE